MFDRIRSLLDRRQEPDSAAYEQDALQLDEGDELPLDDELALSVHEDETSSAPHERAVEPQPPSGHRYVVHSHEQPHPDAAFDHGHVDGLGELDRESFESFLTESVREERLREQIAEIDDDLGELRQQRTQVTSDRLQLADLEAREEALSEDLDRADGKLDRAQKQEDEGPARDPKRGSWLYVLLYVFAGIVFVIGDVAMSRSVVADGLRMEGWWEPWAFAVGLGLLAVLMKPAYDRIIERPYWKGQRKGFYVVIGVCVLLVLGTLFVLGNFRVEAFDAIQAAEEVGSGSMEISVGDILGGESTTDTPPVDEPAEQSPHSSWWAQAAFVLTTLLFAIAGAVCLGIGFQHGRDRRLINLLEARREKAETYADGLRERLHALRTEIATHRKRLEDALALDTLDDQIQSLRSRREELLDQASETRRERLLQLYRNGYELGKERLVWMDRRNPFGGDGRPDPRPGPSGEASAPDSTDRRRPFLALRDAITHNRLGN